VVLSSPQRAGFSPKGADQRVDIGKPKANSGGGALGSWREAAAIQRRGGGVAGAVGGDRRGPDPAASPAAVSSSFPMTIRRILSNLSLRWR
jgi:hypothetical protein